MAIVVTPNLTLVSDCDQTTGWAGGISQMVVDTAVYIQGSASLSCWINATTSATEYYTISTVNMESLGSHVFVWMMCTGLVDTQPNGGYRIVLYTDASNYATFYVGGSDTHGAGWQILCCDAMATPDLETGTFDPSDVTRIGIAFKTLTAAQQKGKEYMNNCFWDVVRYGSGLTITSGDTDAITVADIFAEDDLIANKYGVMTRESGVYFIQGTLTFGDTGGTDAIDFEEENQAIVFRSSNYLADDFNGIVLLGNATGDTNFTMGTKVGTQGIAGCYNKSLHTDTSFEVDMTDADINILKLYGCTFINSDSVNLLPTASGIEVLNTNFTNCGMIVPDTITFANCFVIDSFDIIGLEIGSTSHNVSKCTFIDNTYAVSISGGAGDYNFDQIYFENSATKDVFVAETTGTVTINVLNGGDTPTYDTAGATVVINNAVNLTLHVIDADGNNIENAQSAIYKTSDDSELMNEDTLSTGIATETFNFVSDTAIYWRVRKSSTGATRYFPRNGTGTITSAGFSATITLAEDTIIQ